MEILWHYDPQNTYLKKRIKAEVEQALRSAWVGPPEDKTKTPEEPCGFHGSLRDRIPEWEQPKGGLGLRVSLHEAMQLWWELGGPNEPDAVPQLQKPPRMNMGVSSEFYYRDRHERAAKLYEESGNARAALRELGITNGKRRAKYDVFNVVSDYSALLTREGYICSMAELYRLQDVERRDNLAPIPESAWDPSQCANAPCSPVDALKTVAKWHGWESPEACRKFLVRARQQIKKEKGRFEQRGEPEEFFNFWPTDDFPIPDPSQL